MNPVPSSYRCLMLAQAEAAVQLPTTGELLAGVMGLSVAVASVAMITIWLERMNRTGNALPQAHRPGLRVPMPLAIVGLVLATILVSMAMLVTLLDLEPSRNPKEAAGAANVAEDESREAVDDAALSEEAGVKEEAPAKVEPKMTVEEMVRNLVDNLKLNAVLLAGLAVAVWKLQSQSDDGFREVDLYQAHVPGDERDVLRDDYKSASSEMASARFVNADTAEPEPLSAMAELRFAIEVFLAAWLPTMLVRVGIVLASKALGVEPSQHPFFDMLEGDGGSLIILLIVLNAVLMAPIVEELHFRVVILGGLTQRGYAGFALVLSSMLFAGAHGFPDALSLLPLAFALGYAWQRRRSYVTVMLVHFFFNAFNMGIALMTMK